MVKRSSRWIPLCALILSSIALPGCAAVAGGVAGAAVGHHIAKKHRENERERDAERERDRDNN